MPGLRLGSAADIPATLRPFPATGNDLLQAALTIHEAIFQNASPEIAGRLRTRDVYFGTGVNPLMGVSPAEIEAGIAEKIELEEAAGPPPTSTLIYPG